MVVERGVYTIERGVYTIAGAVWQVHRPFAVSGLLLVVTKG